MMGLIVRKAIDPFKVRKTRSQKEYEIFCDNWDIDGRDLYTHGQTLDELIDNAELFWPDGVRPVATPKGDEHVIYITAEFIKLQERERRGR